MVFYDRLMEGESGVDRKELMLWFHPLYRISWSMSVEMEGCGL